MTKSAEVCCINCRAIYEYVRRRKPEEIGHLFANLPAPLDRMEKPEDFLLDENNWVASEVIVRLFENARVDRRRPEGRL